jgi:phospholipid/cholesterol/gamma-HCH transport system substrate-binding protein
VKISKEIRVGILVTAALAALLWGLNYLKGRDFFTTSNKYYALYNNVDGLVKSNPVLMNGYRIGIINKIEFIPDKSGRLIVTILVNNDVFISKDSRAEIISSDLLGAKALRIDLGNDPTSVENGDTLLGTVEISLTSKLSKQVGPVRDKVESLIVSLDSATQVIKSLFDPATKSNLQTSIVHLNNSLASIDGMVSNDNGKLKVMFSNLESITTNLKSHNSEIGAIISNLSQMTDSLAKANFASAINNADKVMLQTNKIMEKINKGEGTLGLLVNDKTLYNNLETTAKSMDELVKDLRANPKRYVHFSFFGKK